MFIIDSINCLQHLLSGVNNLLVNVKKLELCKKDTKKNDAVSKCLHCKRIHWAAHNNIMP